MTCTLSRQLSALTAVLGVLLAGCGSERPGEALEQVSAPIFGGQNATTCQWPTTVLLNGCTGTLVHPLIVTTAGHCGTDHRTATFGESRTSPGARTVPIASCKVYSGPRIPGVLNDWAYCKLAMPVNDVPIAPILMGCETEILKPMQKVVVAGFGDNNDNGGGFGTKRWAETTINRAETGRGIQVGGMGIAPCFGDSGGPAFVKLADGSWRVFGVDSSGTGNSCGAGDLMALIHPEVPWIEQDSGVDITPCTDADGTWNPSPACTGFSMAPDSTGRSWADGCAEPILSGPAMTCAGDGGVVTMDAGRDATADGAGGRGGAGAGGRGGNAGSTGAGGNGTGGAAGAGGDTGTGGSAGGTAAGAAGMPGSGGGGHAGAGPATGAGGATTTGPIPSHDAQEPSGCSCRVDAKSGSGGLAPIALAAAVLMASRRRRRDAV